MMPSITRKEWRELVLNTDTPKLKSYYFRFKLNSIRRQVKSGIISPEQGINKLYSECETHYKLCKSDLHQIFKD